MSINVKDVKQFLYAWLAKNGFEAPNYSHEADTRNNRTRFKCMLTVKGCSYSAIGNSTSKKDAATNAALDFCQYLVRQGKIAESDLPTLAEQSLDSMNQSGPPAPMPAPPGSMFETFDDLPKGSPFESKKTQMSWDNAYSRSGGTHEQYLAQKAEEIAQSESVDLTSDLHGGWTMDNSKATLNEFCQKTRQPPLQYKTTLKETMNGRTFVAECQIFVPQIGKNVSGRGSGSSKKVAESSCATTIVRQLFHLNIIQAYGGPKRKAGVQKMPEIDLKIPSDLTERVRSFVERSGIKTELVNDTLATEDAPIGLLSDQKLASFPDSEKVDATTVSWAPPLTNWNPWRSSNIDEPPLAFMTMQQISEKITEKEKGKECAEYDNIQKVRSELPVAQYRDELIKTITENRVTLVKGETGCGKSTQVAQFILEDFIYRGQGAYFNAVVSQPRKISAISLAERVANERFEPVGETVGYSVRFDTVSPRPYGSIQFVTVGVLLRMMENGLRGISHVIIDEIHERDIDTDFVLIVLRDMLFEFPQLRVVLMSATVETELFTKFFKQCPVITMHGRTFPVQHFFLEDIIKALKYMPEEPVKGKRTKLTAAVLEDDEGEGDADEADEKSKNLNIMDDSYPPQVKLAMSRIPEVIIPYGVIEAILKDIAERGQPGAVLIFLPGWSEIMQLCNFLSDHAIFSNLNKYEILPLHSQLTSQEQRKVFHHYEGKRKIIISTNIAETSITIDDVVFVIDSCRSKERMYSTSNNMVHFATVWAAKTNVMQRRGRAGRVREGYAFHLCSKKRFEAMDEHSTPEMLRTPLHTIALTIKLLRLGSVGEFLGKALEAPPYDMVIESEAVLQKMGALDKNFELTNLGRMLARMPVEPQLAKIIILATILGQGPLMCDVTASISFQTPFVPREKFHQRLSGAQRAMSGNKYSDHVALAEIMQKFREINEQMDYREEQEFCKRISLSNPILKMTAGARRQLMDVLVNHCKFPQACLFEHHIDIHGKDRELDLLRSLLIMALYPNVCFFRGKRKVFTIDQSTALLSKFSCVSPHINGEDADVPSQLMVFTEKIRSKVVSCKQLSCISPLQLLLFGSRKVECVGPNSVRLDEMINLKTDVNAVKTILELRPIIDAVLIKSCLNPEILQVTTEEDLELRELLRDLSSESFMSLAGPEKDGILTDAAVALKSTPRGRGRGRGGYQDRSQGWFGGCNSGPPNMSFGGGGPAKTGSPNTSYRSHPYGAPYGGGGGGSSFGGPPREEAGDGFGYSSFYENNRGNDGPPGGYRDDYRGGSRGGYGGRGGGYGGRGGGYGGRGGFSGDGGYGGGRGGRGRGRGWF